MRKFFTSASPPQHTPSDPSPLLDHSPAWMSLTKNGFHLLSHSVSHRTAKLASPFDEAQRVAKLKDAEGRGAVPTKWEGNARGVGGWGNKGRLKERQTLAKKVPQENGVKGVAGGGVLTRGEFPHGGILQQFQPEWYRMSLTANPDHRKVQASQQLRQQ